MNPTDQAASDEYRQRLAAIVESSEDAIIGKTLEGVVTSWNRAAEHMYGYKAEEIIGKSISLLAPQEKSDEIARLLELVKSGGVKQYETVRLRKDGKRLQVSLSISPIRDAAGAVVGASTIARDITTLKRLEDQLRQSQKMEAIGRLAGGVAHDFNNLLTAIHGYSEFLLESFDSGDSRRDDIGEIMKAVKRAGNLTHQLLAFSRKQVLAPTVLDLNEVVADMGKMLPRVIGEDIEFSVRLLPLTALVKADRGQLEQVLMNLVVNARDAMPEGGKLSAELGEIILDEDYARLHAGARAGAHVTLSVCDTGCGMDKETLARLFEPFFTTKEPAKGTGLGLSTVYGIITQSGGHVTVYSELGKGSCFRVHLPRAEGTPEPERIGEPRREAGGSETIVVVEDDELVRPVVRKYLADAGYVLIEAASGEEAQERCAKHEGPLHLALIDMVTPGASGPEIAARLKAKHPGLKIIYMSGYTEHASLRRGMDEPGVRFIQKPFTRDSLRAKVREALDAAPERKS